MPRPKTNRCRVHVMLTERQHARLQAMAKKSGYAYSELMRRAVDLFLSKANKDG